MSGDVIINMCSPPYSGGSGGAWTKVDASSGSVSSSVEYIDIPLPDTGLPFFRLTLGRIEVDGDSLCFAFSPDGGSSFPTDLINADSFRFGGYAFSNGTDSFPSGQDGTDSVGYLDLFISAGINHADCMIYAGETGTNASVSAVVTSPLSFSSIAGAAQVITVYDEATGRQNVLRLLPYGNGDTDPPTSGTLILSGTYVLEQMT